jgi:hypothetical protein
MVVHRTGGGKTHILQTLGVIEQKIVLIFILLLTLSAEVMHKFELTNPTWGNVGLAVLSGRRQFSIWPLVV